MQKPIEAMSGAINELVIYQNPLLFLKVWELKRNSVLIGNWHHHKEVEFVAVDCGHMVMYTKRETVPLADGDVFLIGSSQLHRTDRPSANPIRYVVLQVSLTQYLDQSTLPFLHGFSELTNPLDDLNYIFRTDPDARREAHRLVMHIFAEMQTKRRGYEMAIAISVRSLMLLLVRCDKRALLKGSDDVEIIRLKPVLNYVDAHIAEKISVHDVCRLLNLSYHYFVKYFKKVMGVTFLDYVNFKRIKLAEGMLLTRDLSIAEIGCSVGIPNVAQFYKMFRRYNPCSPKEFRLRLREGSGGEGEAGEE
ncbi:AraC family transcriptional regulator [Paenibacillus doosanensis]|uniref:helix-turn-helix domain-containing protein n=1 Tax=Paenibacillus doosanensis TaxID=1229154 RepID=UPI0021802799|nr:AraC family transcriptional regulator [Paenibacillus doosanensis]MCS7462127.1 AraC family transcriptional regulator [Paenibacillus doosanensis]